MSDIVAAHGAASDQAIAVVRAGKLVGIVSRANLLRALASVIGETEPAASQDDASIRTRIYAKLEEQAWAPVNLLDIVVNNGVVHLWGCCSTNGSARPFVSRWKTPPG